MKILIIGDLHYGIKSNDYIIDKVLNKVMEQYIFPYIKQHDIKYIVQLGDVFDNKRGVYSESGYNYVKYFLLPILQNDLTLYQLLGNHDIFYDRSNRANNLKMFFSLVDSPNLKLIEDYEKIILDKREMYFVSYASKLNIEDVYGDVIFGHFSINGFEMQKGIQVINGMKQSIFTNFNKTITGHIHRREQKKNIFNVGSLVEVNFGENDFIHGFYVLETDDLSMEFIPINEKIFVKIEQEKINQLGDLKNKVVEIKLNENNTDITNNKIIEKLKKLNPESVRIKYTNNEKMDIDEVKSYEFIDVVKEYVKNQDGFNKNILYNISMKIYESCMIEN